MVKQIISVSVDEDVVAALVAHFGNEELEQKNLSAGVNAALKYYCKVRGLFPDDRVGWEKKEDVI